MSTPTITILIPLYNGIEFLEQCIRSIENQTYVFWKVLIGVNGYEPNSLVYQKAKEFSNNRILVKEYSTKGKPDTMNEMVKESFTTNLICVLDVDDWWEPNKLEEQIKFWNTGLWDVIGTQCYYVTRGKISNGPNLPIGYIKDFQKCNPIINSSCLMKKKDVYWTNEFFGLDDYELWLRMFHNGKHFFNLPQRLTYHRIHNNSSYNTKNHNLVPLLLSRYYSPNDENT